jgi:hypothetical protein
VDAASEDGGEAEDDGDSDSADDTGGERDGAGGADPASDESDEESADAGDSGSDREEERGSEGDSDPDGSGGSAGDGEPGDDGAGADRTGSDGAEGDDDSADREEGDADESASRGESNSRSTYGDGADTAGSSANVAADEAGDDAEASSLDDPSDDTGDPAEDGSVDGDPRSDEGGEPIDTGADDGEGGVEVPEHGTAADAANLLKEFGGHDDHVASLDEQKDEKAVDIAVIQGLYFETPSQNVNTVRVHRPEDHPDDAVGWSHNTVRMFGWSDKEAGIECDTSVPESVLGGCLQRMRVAFSANRRSDMDRNRKSGRVSSRVLGKRAWADDERLFQKKTIAGKRDYFVVIGIDISGSTTGRNLVLAKRAAMAQAELLHRLGVKFAVYAHSTSLEMSSDGEIGLEIYEIKSAKEPWADSQRRALDALGPVSGNLDGHTIEFYRKRLDESKATDKIMLYYTDGKMPASNYEEELEVLQREIATCKQKEYTLLGVGIRTDSPTKHGLDTVQVDDDSDIIKVVRHLEKRLV